MFILVFQSTEGFLSGFTVMRTAEPTSTPLCPRENWRLKWEWLIWYIQNRTLEFRIQGCDYRTSICQCREEKIWKQIHVSHSMYSVGLPYPVPLPDACQPFHSIPPTVLCHVPWQLGILPHRPTIIRTKMSPDVRNGLQPNFPRLLR